MKAPDGDIRHRSGSYVYVVAGWTILRPCLVLHLGCDGGVGWTGGLKVVVVENQEQEENRAALIWVRCAAIVLSSKAFCDYCTHTHVALILAYDPCPAVLGRPSNRSHLDATRTVIEQYRTSPKGQTHFCNLDLGRRQHGLHSEENSKVFSLRVPLLICTTT